MKFLVTALAVFAATATAETSKDKIEASVFQDCIDHLATDLNAGMNGNLTVCYLLDCSNDMATDKGYGDAFTDMFKILDPICDFDKLH
ncbi:hypothetical protein P175DRAFT_0503649 [Aspergillus ochraceoroseus IBT 24754]|uniref:Fungal calcium binding protein domain-containing protein n=1 Tax=Aspergillus ochraceoroseus IBT 24754 TaxID=1392256 RepID=A0A2T5LRD7_9EURO|nr:uncharacterized protein P175DRAFT_0503649 [Aspergillus ochraceoroseus IBT 24754]PTU18839.1 hypothetical protein P175DRAFT_0503649 [Aspergillus ochraceoroseus IBT 24754]